MSTLENYRNMLRVNKHRLDDELEIQGEIMERISTQVVTHNSAAIDAKEALVKVEGRLADDFRDDDPKATVGAIDAKVKRDPERVTRWEAYQRARAMHEAWQGLLDAWRQKGFSIKTLADLYASQYFSLSSTQSDQRQRERYDQVDAGRAALRRASSSEKHRDPTENITQSTSRRRTAL